MDTNDLTKRLRALGEADVPAHLRDQHITRMAAAATAPATASPNKRFGRVAVAAAALVGFLAGSTGLAMAGALPDPAQDVAHDVLAVVQIDVPEGKDGKRGPCVSAVASDPGFAELSTDDKKAAKDECPKGPFGPPATDGETDRPGNSEHAPGLQPDGRGNSQNTPAGENDGNPSSEKHADEPCKGKPGWVTDDLDADAKAAAQAARDACLDDAEADDLDE